jgi:NarL family two-component system response regulator LiaR
MVEIKIPHLPPQKSPGCPMHPGGFCEILFIEKKGGTTTMKTNPIRVLVVDDHEMVRGSLALFIETFDDLELAGEASDGKEALRLCRQLHPDVVMMDLVMPEMDGIDATRAIRTVLPEIHVVALTSFGEENLVHSAIEAGASECLPKNTPIDQLAHAIRMAHAGKMVEVSSQA